MHFFKGAAATALHLLLVFHLCAQETSVTNSQAEKLAKTIDEKLDKFEAEVGACTSKTLNKLSIYERKLLSGIVSGKEKATCKFTCDS